MAFGRTDEGDFGPGSEIFFGEEDSGQAGRNTFGGSTGDAQDPFRISQNAQRAVATAQSGREAAQGAAREDIGTSEQISERFGAIAKQFQGGTGGFDARQLDRLMQRAQGVGVSPGEQALNQAISGGAAGQQRLAAGAAPGNLITAQRQGQRAAARGTRDIDRNRELVRLQDQFGAQDQLSQVLAQQRGQQTDLAALLGGQAVNLGKLQGGALSGGLQTGIGRETGLQGLQLDQILAQLSSDVKLQQLLAGKKPDEGLLGGILSAAGGAVAGGLGGFGGGGGGGGGATGSDDILNNLGFSGNNNISNDQLLAGI